MLDCDGGAVGLRAFGEDAEPERDRLAVGLRQIANRELDAGHAPGSVVARCR